MLQKQLLKSSIARRPDFEMIRRIEIEKGYGFSRATHFQGIAMCYGNPTILCLLGSECVKFDAITMAVASLQ